MEETLVKLHAPQGEDVVRLSTLDQQAQRNYAHVLVALALAPGSRVDETVHHLKQGLSMALCELPDLAGLVAPRPGSIRKELELRLGPDSGVRFRVVDHTAAEQSPFKARRFEDLVENNFPIASLPREHLFVPHPTCEDATVEGLSVVLAQINFIEGGILMGLSWHHSACDARGFGMLTTAWARHTKALVARGKPDLDSIVEAGEQTRERWRLEHGSRDATIAQFPNYVVDPAERSPLNPAAPHLLDRPDPVAATAEMCTWHFSDEILRSLRKALNAASDEIDAHFTRSEAASALVWKHLSLARRLDAANPDGTSLFSTRIDFRARMKPPFSDSFVGNLVEPNACVRMALAELCTPSTPLSVANLALAVRGAVTALDDKAVHDFIGLVDSLPTVTDLTWRYDTYPGPDLAISDMSGLELLKEDWGTTLGYPVCMRSCSQEKGLAYFLPMDRDGGFDVQVQCEKVAMERLKRDDIFARYAMFRS
ncbi:hypothetical protein ACO1O0_003619 [Amphichorda felina]